MINALPDLVLALIFNFLSETERICTATLVCRRWYDVIHSSTVWTKVDFDFQRRNHIGHPGKNLSTQIQGKFFLSECHVLSRCRKPMQKALNLGSGLDWLQKTNCSFLYSFTEILNIGYLRFLQLSHCKITSSLFGVLPLKCPILEMLFIDDCQEITQESYEISPFEQHKHLKLLCVAYNRALSVHCVV